MNAILAKILKWLPVNLGGVIGVLQAIVKLLKEILTLIVDILFPIIPNAKFKVAIEALRKAINAIDAILEKIKGFFLKVVG